jgi:hypothetical protein
VDLVWLGVHWMKRRRGLAGRTVNAAMDPAASSGMAGGGSQDIACLLSL